MKTNEYRLFNVECLPEEVKNVFPINSHLPHHMVDILLSESDCLTVPHSDNFGVIRGYDGVYFSSPLMQGRILSLTFRL